MAAEAIKIRAAAAKLYKESGDEAIADYRKMPLDDLKTHIERIQKGSKSAPAKGKTAPAVNGSPAPARQKGKVAPVAAPVKTKTTPAKGKTSARTSAPAKSTTRKSSPAKGKAATGTAKRPTAATGKGKATATKGKTAPAKGRATAKPKTGTVKTATAKRTPAKRGKVQGAARIDNKAIDWKAPWNGGQSGKRGDVMDALRQFKGDKDKVFVQLQPKARTYYKGHANPEGMLRWLIGRVAFDFVTTTGQHEKGTRDAHGTSTNLKNIRRRELREERAKEAAKAARAAARAKTTTRGTKPPKAAPVGRGRKTAATRGKGKR